jgi:hypothetical protein
MASVDSSALDAVVGCISGLCFEQIAPWVGSLDACGFRGRRVVIHFRVDPQTVAELERRGYETYDASCLHSAGNRAFKKNPEDAEISVNRFYPYFLSHVAVAPYARYLMAMDVSDVVFQRSPSLWLEQNLGKSNLWSAASRFSSRMSRGALRPCRNAMGLTSGRLIDASSSITLER